MVKYNRFQVGGFQFFPLAMVMVIMGSVVGIFSLYKAESVQGTAWTNEMQFWIKHAPE